MTATELLRSALEREHEKRISLAKDGERIDVARDCVKQRDCFERNVRDSFLGPGVDAAVYALAGVDP